MPGSYSWRAETTLRIEGLQKAMKTVAAACKPKVPDKISTDNPSKKANINNNALGVSKGNNKINKI